MNTAEQLRARLKREDELRPIIEAYIAGKPVWYRDIRSKRWEQSKIDRGHGDLSFSSAPAFASIQYRLTPPPPEKLTVKLELTPSAALTLLNKLNVCEADAEPTWPVTLDAVGNNGVVPANCYATFWEHKDSLAAQLLAFLQAQD